MTTFARSALLCGAGTLLSLSVLFTGGCASRSYVQTEMTASRALTTSRVDEVDRKLQQISQSLESKISSAQSGSSTADQELRRELDRLREDLEKLDEALSARLDRHDTDLRALGDTDRDIERRVTEVRNSVSSGLSDTKGELQAVENRLAEEMTEFGNELRRDFEEETGQLRGEMDAVRAENDAVREDTRRMAAVMRKGVVRELAIVGEHYQALAGAMETLNDVVGQDMEGQPRVRFEDLFANATNAHRAALDTGDLGEYQEALEMYLAALQLDPEHVTANYNTASILLELDRVNDAEPYLQNVLAHDREGRFSSSVSRLLNQIRAGGE